MDTITKNFIQNRALFLDRDGVINHLVPRDGGYYSPRSVREFILKEDAIEAIIKAKHLGFFCVVISNQPDISRGKLSREELAKMTELLKSKIDLDAVIYCTHDDENDIGCRKPKPGMLFQVCDKWNIDLTESFMVGDSWKDVEAAKRAGVTHLLIDADYNRNLNVEYRVENLLSAVKLIYKLVNNHHQDILKG